MSASKSKSAAARALGKLGASKGGKARAKALGGTTRKAIASHAAKKRWGKSTSYTLAPYWHARARRRNKSV